MLTFKCLFFSNAAVADIVTGGAGFFHAVSRYACRMTDTPKNKMDCLYQRYQKETMCHTFSRSRLLIIFSTMILTLILYPVVTMLGARVYVLVSGAYMSGHHSILLINCPTEQAAKDVGRQIMEKRMAACVNILPRTSTMYYWKGEIQDASEILLLVRTRSSLIQKITDYVKNVHPYEIPEILSFPIDGGSMPYLKWIDDAVPEICRIWYRAQCQTVICSICATVSDGSVP